VVLTTLLSLIYQLTDGALINDESEANNHHCQHIRWRSHCCESMRHRCSEVRLHLMAPSPWLSTLAVHHYLNNPRFSVTTVDQQRIGIDPSTQYEPARPTMKARHARIDYST